MLLRLDSAESVKVRAQEGTLPPHECVALGVFVGDNFLVNGPEVKHDLFPPAGPYAPDPNVLLAPVHIVTTLLCGPTLESQAEVYLGADASLLNALVHDLLFILSSDQSATYCQLPPPLRLLVHDLHASLAVPTASQEFLLATHAVARSFVMVCEAAAVQRANVFKFEQHRAATVRSILDYLRQPSEREAGLQLQKNKLGEVRFGKSRARYSAKAVFAQVAERFAKVFKRV